MNILQNLFMKDVYNKQELIKLQEENEEELFDLNQELHRKLGYTVNNQVFMEVSLHLLLKTHDTSEILEILQEFKQLK